MSIFFIILFGLVVLSTHFLEGITGFGCTVLALPFCTIRKPAEEPYTSWKTNACKNDNLQVFLPNYLPEIDGYDVKC
jgi:hypothetical protein